MKLKIQWTPVLFMGFNLFEEKNPSGDIKLNHKKRQSLVCGFEVLANVQSFGFIGQCEMNH